MEDSGPIIDTKEAVSAIGETLTAFLKSGPQYQNHLEDTFASILESVHSIIPSSEAATASYERVCAEFLDRVVQVRGMPTAVIFSNGENEAQKVSSSGSGIAEIFDALLPSIKERLRWCVENYRSQADTYLNEQIRQFQDYIRIFLDKIPVNGTKDKVIKSEISVIKKDLRYIIGWNKLFYRYKIMSFPTEVENIFTLTQNPLAAIWHYNPIDAQGEYQKTYDHHPRDGLVYAVRGNWAMDKGLMEVGPGGYLDEIDMPCRELGCMCSLQWLFSLRSLPSNMMTAKGSSDLARARAAIQAGLPPEPQSKPLEPDTEPSRPRSKLMSWLGFRAS